MPASVTTVVRLGFATLGLAFASTVLGAQSSTAPAGAPPATAGSAKASDAATKTAGRELFANWSCGSCHSLADAGGTGHVGPSFDGNPNLTEAFVINRVTNGQGAMPAFGGQLTDAEIATLAAYVTHAAAK
ncbi:MAG: c-type cytochrome [Janthinobacterium lividum]